MFTKIMATKLPLSYWTESSKPEDIFNYVTTKFSKLSAVEKERPLKLT